MISPSLPLKCFPANVFHRSELLAGPIALAVASCLLWLPESLDAQERHALTVTALAVIGWTMTRLPDALVALAAALALVLTGTLHEQQLFAALGRELVWLLMAAFVIASVLKSSGLMEHLVARALTRVRSFAALSYVLTVLIAATAFFIPSTSGRAALLLPVFLALAAQLPDPRLRRPLALLFPTVILLSAGGSLLGAGAHLIAVDAIASAGGPRIGYLEWLMLGLPVSLVCCLLATALILWLFVPADLHNMPMVLRQPGAPLTTRQRRLALMLVALLALWTTTSLHGMSIVVITLAGALLLLSRPFTDRKTKEVFRDVDVELILYLTATIVIAEAMITSGADRWLAEGMLAVLPEDLARSQAVAVGFMAGVAVLSHLVITSRSARAAVLIPAVALPIAAFGHDPALIVLVAVMGTGFCQTMMASAKPVAIYGALDMPTFSQRDLVRLAVPLMPAVVVPLFCVAITLWPMQLQRPTDPAFAVIQKVELSEPVPRAVLRPVARPALTGQRGAALSQSSDRDQPRVIRWLGAEIDAAGQDAQRGLHRLTDVLGLR
ncbi:transporter [Roseobacter cerasinus]|uniref:Transporter n=1 Tax=Roseobacter cerasinus TaxID=2602289 RepID=A0A640VLD7_9RHOB|nr:SLC13 family permease [Roseobacter cerasinus]GFE48424.1 transporter [Roseobacter cerasinus]